MQKSCRICGKEFQTLPNGGSRQFCFDCVPKDLDRIKRTTEKRRALKRQGVSLLGNKCLKCGEDRVHVLSFHHLVREEKEHSLSGLISNSKIEEFFEELKKCILLCSNCHLDFHWQESLQKISIEEYLNCDLILLENIQHNTAYSRVTHFCQECGTEISYGSKTNLCLACYNKTTRKVDRPSKEQLEEELKQSNFTQVGKKYGVSSSAVRKWCVSYGISSYAKDYK